jgi:hypothetical protein
MTREIELITTPQELQNWMSDNDVQMEFSSDDLEILLGYLEGHGYALAKDTNNQLVRVDMESDEMEVDEYTLDDAIDQACDWNYSLILEADENRNNPKNMIDFANEQARYEKYKRDEEILDKMFEQTKFMPPIEALARKIAAEVLETYELGVEKVVQTVTDQIRGFQPERVR